MDSKKLNVKDFINVGIFAALIFVVEFAAGMSGFIHPFIVAAYVAIIPLLSAIPMMLFYTKVEKFGMITMMATLLAIIMYFTGMGWMGAPMILAVGVISDLIEKSGNYKNSKKTIISFGVFSMWCSANFLPVVFTADSYRENLQSGNFSSEYVDGLFTYINTTTLIPLIVLSFIFGVIGAIIGKKVVKKHFEKAGIA
ncbi:MptD family putative ECF transporter S component [Gemella bergeri]